MNCALVTLHASKVSFVLLQIPEEVAQLQNKDLALIAGDLLNTRSLLLAEGKWPLIFASRISACKRQVVLGSDLELRDQA